MEPTTVLLIGGVSLAAVLFLQAGGPAVVGWVRRKLSAATVQSPLVPTPPPLWPVPSPEPVTPPVTQFGADDPPPPLVVDWWRHIAQAGGPVEFTADCIATGLTLREALLARLAAVEQSPESVTRVTRSRKAKP